MTTFVTSSLSSKAAIVSLDTAGAVSFEGHFFKREGRGELTFTLSNADAATLAAQLIRALPPDIMRPAVCGALNDVARRTDSLHAPARDLPDHGVL
jgi:hypothetical protein